MNREIFRSAVSQEPLPLNHAWACFKCGLVLTKPQSVSILLLAYLGFADSGIFINKVLKIFTQLGFLNLRSGNPSVCCVAGKKVGLLDHSC